MKRTFYCILSAFLALTAQAFAYTSDETIASDITSAITRADLAKPYSLQVDVTNGDVVLSGKVPSEQVKDRMEALAREVKGVSDVENDLIVTHMTTHTANMEGSILCKEIEARLATLERVNEFRVSLDCETDIVRLMGTAYREDDIALIEKTVRSTSGVRDVINQMRLPPEMSDSYLEEAVREELVQKGRISLTGLSFTVSDGVASFSGHVDTHEEIDKILARTLMVQGIKDVKSNVSIGRIQ